MTAPALPPLERGRDTPPAAPRRRTPLLGLAAVVALGYVGTRVSALAIPWFVLTTTGSATATAVVAAAELGPYVIVKVLGGPLVDRLGQRRVSILSDIASAIALLAVPVLHAVGSLPFWLLLVLVALIGALRGPGDNAKHTCQPQVAELAGWPLERATGIFGAIERGSGLVAPALATAVITFVSPVGGLVVNAVCFGLGALVAALTLPRGIDRVPTSSTGGEAAGESPTDEGRTSGEPGYWRSLAEGFSFLRKDSALMALTVMIAVTNLFDLAKATVLLPVWAERTPYGIAAVGLLLTCFAACSVISSLVAGALGPRLPRRLVFFVGFALCGPPPFLVLGLDLPLPAVAATYALGGFAAGFLNPILGAAFFERIPRPLLGRVGGLSDAVAWAGTPFGGLVAAALLAGIGFGPTFWVVAVGYAVAIAVPGLGFPGLFHRRSRSADQR